MAILYAYRSLILLGLARHGLRPTPSTSPEFVRQALADLYLYEIRRLRKQVKRGAFPKEDYASMVEALRKRYSLLSLDLRLWAEDSGIQQQS
jgi:hypothetical protein